MPAINLNRVLFPEPLAPIKPSVSPRLRSKLTSSSAQNSSLRSVEESGLTRRDCLKLCGAGFCALSAVQLSGCIEAASALMPTKGLIRTTLSPHFTALSGGEVQCELCPRQCRISKGKRGFCKVRENRDGKLYSLVYGNPCAFHLDPIEKNPFFHVLPSSRSLSLATAGCNFQ